MSISFSDSGVTFPDTSIQASAQKPQIQSLGISLASNALTIASQAFSLSFKTSLTSGAVATITGSPAALTIPSGATLGTVSAVQSSIIVAVLNNAGTLEYTVQNLAGGSDMSETGLITTVAITAGATANNVWYSNTARTSVPYQIIYRFDSTQATAGTWATAASLMQGAGVIRLLPNLLTLATAQATTSGTSIDFTGIPSWVKRITVMLAAVSTNGTSEYLVQIGSAGAIQTSGYTGAATYFGAASAALNLSSGFILRADDAAEVEHGLATLCLLNPATGLWCMTGLTGHSNETYLSATGGSKTLSGILDRIRLTTVNGTDTFDAGSVNILYE